MKHSWKLLSRPFDESLREALQQQHHAAQFIALTGRHLLPQQPDDSNTNMEYLPGKGLLAGHEVVPGVRLALHLTEMKLCILSGEECTGEIPLDGKTRQQVFEMTRELLSGAGIDVSRLKDELHYEIPEHPLDKGAAYNTRDRERFGENTLYRHNAQIILEEITARRTEADPVRIWPHHFDTGTLIPLEQDRQGNLLKSLGPGLAIPDSMVPEPYFYLSFWSKDPAEVPGNMPAPGKGRWMMPQWNGAILPLSTLLKASGAEEQHLMAQEFFLSGIETLSNL